MQSEWLMGKEKKAWAGRGQKAEDGEITGRQIVPLSSPPLSSQSLLSPKAK